MSRRIDLKPTLRNSELYLNRSRACLEEASAASLPRVRERALRAATAWQEMYDKALLSEQRSSR